MKHSPEDLEKLIHQTLRALPDRRAPRSLENRVLAAIEARATLPWWRQSFAHWPMAARCVFLVVSGAVVKLVLMAVVWALAGFNTAEAANALATPIAWLEGANQTVRAAGGFALHLVRSIPPVWLYAGLAGLAAVYATLFGLGAAAYRTLFADR